MSYKTILVHLADTRRAKRLLDVAVPLAAKMKSHLIGLSILPPYVVVPAMDMGGGGSNALRDISDYLRADDIRGVEIYRAMGGIPQRFDWNNGCGVILIWSQ